ncbi:MAG TPA: zinc ribbon domain-containing protein [Opitutaceae bacterium]|nr:zinc ribbon domain-containing protein [Opitutaceae bacterium]
MPEPAKPPSECANCGATIPPGARSCPECGADERTGWRETSIYDGLDLPEEDETDAGPGQTRMPRVNGIAWYWWIVGIGLLLLLVFGRWLW